MAKTKQERKGINESDQTQGEDWFRRVVDENWETIFYTTLKLTGDESLSEDITLETFWKLWKCPPNRQDNLKAWLYRVAINLGYNAIRSNRRRGNYEMTAGCTDWLDQDTMTPEEAYDKNQEREKIRSALAQMKPRQAKILILRHSGQSYRQISEILQIRYSSVGALILKAEREFVKLYEQLGS